MARVLVNKSVLQWALDRSDCTVEELLNKFPKIVQWFSGESGPTLKQLESLSKTTLTPFGFFFLPEPPLEKLPIPHFRTLGDEGLRGPSPELLETIRAMQRRQAWMREYLIEEDHESLAFVGSRKKGERPKAVAQRMREMLGLAEDWASRHSTWTDALRTLRIAIDASGILVVVNGIVGNNTHRKLDLSEFRGFVLADEYAPLVFVNGTDSKAAQMFTLGHELAHVLYGTSAAFDLKQLQPANNATEQACNKIAAEFLVPGEAFRKQWMTVPKSTNSFQAMARHFKVSVLVVARRALDLGLIDRNEFFVFYQQYQEQDLHLRSSRKNGGQFYTTQDFRIGRRFAYAIARATSEGRLLYSEAYRLTGLYGNTFDQYISKFELGGR